MTLQNGIDKMIIWIFTLHGIQCMIHVIYLYDYMILFEHTVITIIYLSALSNAILIFTALIEFENRIYP